MNPPNESRKPAAEQMRQRHRLMQLGMSLLLIALLTGLVIQKMPLPRLALSTYLLGTMQGTFLAVVGLLWPETSLRRTARTSRLYCSCMAALPWLVNLLGAIWAAGGSMVPLAAGQARGTVLQEYVITIGLRTAAASYKLRRTVRPHYPAVSPRRIDRAVRDSSQQRAVRD